MSPTADYVYATTSAPWHLRLRGRVGLWLIYPHLRSFLRQYRQAREAGHDGGGYGPDYWLCKWFGVEQVLDALRRGHMATPWEKWTAVHNGREGVE